MLAPASVGWISRLRYPGWGGLRSRAHCRGRQRLVAELLKRLALGFRQGRDGQQHAGEGDDRGDYLRAADAERGGKKVREQEGAEERAQLPRPGRDAVGGRADLGREDLGRIDERRGVGPELGEEVADPVQQGERQGGRRHGWDEPDE